MADLLVLSLIGGLFSLIGGIFLLWKAELTNKLIIPLISFGAGAFLGAAFLDILPEALELTGDPNPVLKATVVGFIIFFVLERLVMKFFPHYHGKHQHSEHTESLPLLLIAADCIHNFFDGIVIALAYIADPLLGLPAAIAIASHELPQEIGDFSVLMHLGWKKRNIIIVNVLQSLITIPGVFLGIYLGTTIKGYLPLLLGATAGIFIYLAASDLVPELHHRSGHKHFFRIILPFITSIFLLQQILSLLHPD